MATTKSLTIVDSVGQVMGSNDIGAEAQNIEIARDAEGKIIADIYEPGVTIQSRQGVAEAIKNIEEAGSGLVFDDVPIAGSDNPVKSDGLVPDDGLDLESSRPVENRVITERLNEKISNFEISPSSWDTVPTQNSGKPITSGGVYSALNNVHITVDDTLSTTSANPVQNSVITSALNNKQNTLTFDNVPTENSNNPVTSDGVYSALNNLDTTKYYLKDAPIVSASNFNYIMNEAFDAWVDDNLDPTTMTHGDLGKKLGKLYFDIYNADDYYHCVFTRNTYYADAETGKEFIASFDHYKTFITTNSIRFKSFNVTLTSNNLLNPSRSRYNTCTLTEMSGAFDTVSPYINSDLTNDKFNTDDDTLDITDMRVSMYTM